MYAIRSYYADLHADLVDEDHAAVALGDGGGEFAQRLGHQAGLQADVGVPHLPLDLGLGDQGGDRVDDQHVITSYSIHYTKLYERARPRVGLEHGLAVLEQVVNQPLQVARLLDDHSEVALYVGVLQVLGDVGEGLKEERDGGP